MFHFTYHIAIFFSLTTFTHGDDHCTYVLYRRLPGIMIRKKKMKKSENKLEMDTAVKRVFVALGPLIIGILKQYAVRFFSPSSPRP